MLCAFRFHQLSKTKAFSEFLGSRTLSSFSSALNHRNLNLNKSQTTRNLAAFVLTNGNQCFYSIGAASQSNNIRNESNKSSSNNKMSTQQKFKKVCLGGTFDRLHPGHYVLLNKSIEVCSSIVIIGLTDESMNKSKKFAELIEPFEVRRDNIVKYMKSQNDKLDYQVFRLNEPYGPAIVDPEIEAMVVSEETAKSAEKCNVIRAEKSMKPLQIVVVPCLPNNDDKSDVKLSSTYFRQLEFQKRQQQQQQQQK